MKYIKTLKIDIDKKNFEVIPSVQYDSNTRFLHIQLLNDSVPFDITGCSVILSGVKEDGNPIFNSCDIINSEIGFIQAEVTEQMNAIPGNIDCEIKIYDGKGVLTSKKFTIKVTASQTSRSVVSSNEFKALTDALNKVQAIDNKAEKAEVEKLSSQLGNKASKNEIFTMANMGQDIKEAMTGGSVAVVGKNTVLTENIVDRQVTREKLSDLNRITDIFSDIDTKYFEEIDNYYYNSTSHVLTEHEGYKIWKVSAIDNELVLKCKNVFRIFLYKGEPSKETFIEKVGGIDNPKEQTINLKKGYVLGIIISKNSSLTPYLKTLPYYSLNGLKINSDDVNGKFSKEKLDFIVERRINLFDGNFSNYYLQGNSKDEDYRITENSSYKTLVIDISPNTTYTILKESISVDVSGYWYFKVGTFTIPKEELVNNYYVDGNVRFTSTNRDTTKYTFTSGENDKTLVVTVAKSLLPYVEILEGEYSSFQVNSYDPLYEFNGVDVYNKREVNNLIKDVKENLSNHANSLTKKGDVIEITLSSKISYTLQRNTKSNINLDTFMLTKGGVTPKGTVDEVVLWSGSDIEGPIKEVNTNDFIGGVHGDEIYESINILCDGKILDLSKDYNTNFTNLTIFIKSKLYRCDTTIPVFDRYKKLEFINNELIVSNKIVCLVDDFKVYRYCGCGLYSVYKDCLNGYTVNTKHDFINEGSVNKDNKLDSGTFYGDGYTVSIKTLQGKTDYYRGSVADFSSETRPRFKLYLDTINSSEGVLLTQGQELTTSFSIKIDVY